MGIGNDHAKWSPFATLIIQYGPHIHINKEFMELLSLNEKWNWMLNTKVFELDLFFTKWMFEPSPYDIIVYSLLNVGYDFNELFSTFN